MWNKATGFIVVGEPILLNGITYSGVNTDPWPIGTDFDSEIAENICEIAYLDLEYPMLVDFDSAVRYFHSCKCVGINARMLYCEVYMDHLVNSLPQFDNPRKSICLGFDYAYPSGDYYSAVINDIISKKIPFPTCWFNNLNKYGLLQDIEALIHFVNERNFAVTDNRKNSQDLLLEKGYFAKFCVHCLT